MSKDANPKKKYTQKVDYSESRRAFLNLPGVSFILFTDPPGADGDDKPAPNVTVKIARANRHMVIVNLTHMRADEIAAIREFFEIALATALPAADIMDEEAERELDNDIDTNPRLYREVPRVFVREGEKLRDHPSLLRGYNWSDRFPSFEQSAGIGFAKRGRRSPVPKQDTTGDAAHLGEEEAGEH